MPHPFFRKQLKQPFTEKSSILDLEIMNPKTTIVFGAADWTEAMEDVPLPESEYWVMHFDGSRMLQGSGAGVVLRNPLGDKLSYVLQIHFKATNNVAEYEALLHGLHIARDLGVQRVLCYGDSDLVAQQVRGTWNTKTETMAAYRAAVDEFAKCFLGYEVRHIPRAQNEAADTLARLGSERRKVQIGRASCRERV